MQVIVKKLCNSTSVHIPATMMKAARLYLDEIVDVREEGLYIMIEPVRPSEYNR
jgi:antitoxin component of MazEF toxin-antitoxin module